MKPATHPPRWSAGLLQRLFPDGGAFTTAGDLEEVFHEIAAQQGPAVARWWYRGQVCRALPSYLIHTFAWHAAMLPNYLKVALRVLVRHKGYSFLNLAGLATGLACVLMILLWVQDEYRYDRFHEHAEEIYRLERDFGRVASTPAVAAPVGPAIAEQVPEVQAFTRYTRLRRVSLLRRGERTFYEESLAAVDPNFLSMFTFPLLQGDAASALADPFSVVLTEQLAARYFGAEDPIGQTLELDNQHTLTVTGVLADVPAQSSLAFDILVPLELLRTLGGYADSWRSNWLHTYIRLPDPADVPTASNAITQIYYANTGTWTQENMKRVVLNPLATMYLDAYIHTGKGFEQVHRKYIYIFSVLALFVLLIAGINFMNLSTARAVRRAKEIGMRKVVGAHRLNVVAQFLGESILMAGLALLLALGCLALLLPAFNELADKQIRWGEVVEGMFLWGVLGITLLTGVLAGSYPAFYLSGFRPVAVLKGRLQPQAGRVGLRSALVVVQFSLSIFLIVGMLVVTAQLRFLQTKNLGYTSERVVYVPLFQDESRAAFGALKQRWQDLPDVAAVTAAQQRPSSISWNSSADWEGKPATEDVFVNHNRVAYDYFETLGIPIREGRSFDPTRPADAARNGEGVFILNATAARLLGKPSVLGERFELGNVEGTIIGVVDDFHFESLRKAIRPLAVMLVPEQARYALVRLDNEDMTPALEALQREWQAVLPDHPFKYHFLYEDFEQMYRTETRLSELIQVFTLVALFVACLGLFGLAAFLGEMRRKEVAVRKVLGASLLGVVRLLCQEFVWLVLLANAVAWPLAWYVMQAWLATFAYHIDLSWGLFFGAGGGALLIALLTVGYQAVRTALVNPATVLKYE